MTEKIIEYIEKIAKGSALRQFSNLMKIAILLLSIFGATLIYRNYFTQVIAGTDFRSIFQLVLDPYSIVWLILFCLLFFGVYPFLSRIPAGLYTVLFPVSKKIKTRTPSLLNKELKRVGIDELMKNIPASKADLFYRESLMETIAAENKLAQALSTLFIIVLQFLIHRTIFLNQQPGLIKLFVIVAVILIILLFIVMPVMFKIARSAFSKENLTIDDDNLPNKRNQSEHAQ